MPPSGEPPAEQSPETIAAALEAFLTQHPKAIVLEEGKAIFDMRLAKYSLATEHGRCTLHLWSEERNLVRRVGAAFERKGALRLTTHKFGQTRPVMLEMAPDKDRRSPSTREAARAKYVRSLERTLMRTFAPWKPEAFRTAMDLEKSFGPAYARGVLVRGTGGGTGGGSAAWAVIGVNAEESQATVDGILTLGILWLADCRERAGGRRLFQGLKVVVPQGRAALTASRMPWLSELAAQWELWEFDEGEEELVEREKGDHGNMMTRLIHAPNETAVRERFAAAAERVMQLVPDGMRGAVEQRIRGGAEMAFLLHGLEFARIRTEFAGDSFNRVEEITFGAGAQETLLTAETEASLRGMVARLFERRIAGGNYKDPLYRMQPERWLESVLRRDVALIDGKLDGAHVYTQVPAFAGCDRGMLDLLGVLKDGRLAVIELKADEDLQLALQGLDYWVRVRAHHLENPDRMSGLGEFQRHGYFGGVRLAEGPPRLYLVAPALRVHPATEVVLRYLSPRVEWRLVAIGEDWRRVVKVIWRKSSEEK